MKPSTLLANALSALAVSSDELGLSQMSVATYEPLTKKAVPVRDRLAMRSVDSRFKDFSRGEYDFSNTLNRDIYAVPGGFLSVFPR